MLMGQSNRGSSSSVAPPPQVTVFGVRVTKTKQHTGLLWTQGEPSW